MWGCQYTRRKTIAGILAIMLALLLLSTFSFASNDRTIFGPKRYDRQKGKPTVYTDNFAGCIAGEQATLKVINGDSRKTRVTSARIYINDINAASERDFKRKKPSFEKTVTINKTNELKIILKGGHHSYHKWLKEYLERKGDLADVLSTLQDLRERITQSGNKLNSREIDHLLREFQDIGKSCDDRDSILMRLSKSLDDEFEEDEDDDNDNDDPFDSNWLREQRAAFEKNRKEIEKAYDDCTRFRDAHDRAKPNYRDYEYDKKKEVLHSLCDFLKELDKAVKRAVSRLSEIEEKIEHWNKEHAFIIIEIIGKICDEAAPVLSNPQPADGSIINSSTPAISVQYADGAAGAGIDTASVRMILDGRDVTSLSAVTDTSVSYTPAENLTEGQHAVTVNVFDKAHNQASLTWSFTIRTIVTVVKIASHQNNQYINTPAITVSGSISNPEAAVTVNGGAAEVSGNSFSLSGVALTEGPNTITAEARDAAGNVSRDSIIINLDTIAPVVRVTTPAPDTYVNTSTVAVVGNVSEPVTSVTVNGASAEVVGTDFSLSGLQLVDGANTVTVEARDRAGNPGTATIAVTLDTEPPVVDITAPQADAYLNTPVIAVTGTLNETVASVTVNGAAAAITGNEFSLGSLTLVEGANAIVVAAKDQAGNIGTVAITVNLDREQPVIQITSSAPVAYVNTPIFTVAGTVNEPVASVTVNGVSAQVAGTDFSLPGVGLVEGANTITVETRDRAGNFGTATVTINLDTAPPVVRITAPASNSFVNTPVIAVAGTVSEPGSVVMVNGVLAQVTGTNFNLTGFALAEGQNIITALATDRAGNTGAGNASITLDTSPPVIALNAPAQAAAGANVSIATSAADNSGLALCELFVNQAPVWSFAANSQPSASNAIAYSLSPDLAPGTTLNLTARAYDIAGNMGEASAQITISQGPSGPGYIQGQVYDDTKGLRLDGASAGIHDANGQVLTGLTTTADGRYFYQTPAGNYLIMLAKEGFTTVERLISVRPEKNSVATDARLTPVSTVQSLIGADGGRITAGAGLELTVPAGALNQQADIRVTPISNQGTAGLLPIGWSPIAAVDIRIPGTAAMFLQPASLKIPLAAAVALAPSSTLPLAIYDASVHQWVVQGLGTVIADGAFVAAPIPFLGQYAVVLPDHGLVPPALIAGQPLPPFSVTSATDGISATGKVVPPAAPPAVGLRAVGEVIASNETSPLHSGLLINGRVTERFDLLTGETIVPSDYIQDIILYQYPCVTNIAPASTGSTLNSDLDALNMGKVGTSFPVMPSRECTIIDLLAGKVNIEISLPQTEAKGAMVGADGARIADAEGNVLVIPLNALAQTVPVEMKTIQPSLVAGIVESDFTLLRAVDINLANRTLAQTAEISIPVPTGLDPAYPIIVAKLIDVRGAGRLKLVALANVSGSLITSVSLPAGGGSPGITTSGSYFFIQARAALGFVKGLVTDVGGNAYPSALVTSNTCSLVDLTGADGNYLIASTVSAFAARATDIYKYDEGEGEGLLAAAGQTAIVNLTIRMIPPRVDAVAFTDSGRGIETNTSITVTFNKALDKTTVTGDNIMLKDASGNTISGSFSTNPEGTVVTFYPATLLASQASYTLTVSKNIKDLQGYLMVQDEVRSFTVRNTTPPPMPPAGSVVGSFPDANGYVTITATQGSADATNTVLIMNDTTGETLSVTPATNGSFTGRIFAMLGDEIRILLMDNAGNQTLISTIAMKDAEGRHLVTTKGGTVEGEGGTKLVIPDGALPGPTIVKITPITEASLSQPVPPEARFLAAVNIDAGGAKFLKPVKLSVPAPANVADIPAGSMPFVSQPAEITNADGTKEQVYIVADSAKVIDGRLTTASPPFDGVLFGGNWIFEFPYMDVAIISGYTYRDMNGTSGYQPGADLPVKRAVIRTPGAWNHVSYSDENGHFAAFAEVMANVPGYPGRKWGLTAINPLTMARVESNVMIWDWPANLISNFNIQLADQDTMPLDKAAPEIGMNMTVVPGQVIPGLNTPPQFVAGTIPAGTDIDVPISIVDREMGSATLTISYTSPDGLSNQTYSAQLSQTSSAVQSFVTADNPVAINRYTYQASFPETIAGSQAKYFKPGSPGTYTFTVEARDAAGNKSSRSLEVRAIPPGEMPSGINGAPRVDEILPRDQYANIMVSTTISITFSEPVDTATLTADSFKLIDLTTGSPVTSFIYTSLEGGRMKATLLPHNNLSYGREYEIVVTRSVKDSVANDPPFEEFMPLDREYRARFTTKSPTLYDMEGAFALTPGGMGGTDIALYTDRTTGRSYAYVALEESGWGAVDVTDPANPVMTDQVNHTQPPQSPSPYVSWRYRGVSVDQEQGILAVTEWITFHNVESSLGNYGYIGFYDLKANPAKPVLIGRDRLAENFSGVPYHVALSGNYAYVATIMVGIQVVDVEKATASHQPGDAIVGYYDSMGEGYQSPYDVAMLKGNLYVTTSKGHLLVLSTGVPQLPSLIGKIEPVDGGFRAYRAAVMGDYPYTDAAGQTQNMDIAVVSNGLGNIYIVNVTDPTNPKIVSSLTGIAGTDISINKSGTAYITAGTTVDVVDIKDPSHPKLLNTVGNESYADGSSVSPGYNRALVEQDGWLYLANQQEGMRVLNLDPFFPKIVDLAGADIHEVKYASDGNDAKKAFLVKVSTDNATRDCPQLKGTISVRTLSGTSEQIVQVPAGIDYQAKYDLSFEKESDTICAATAGAPRFILSNLPKDKISNLTSAVPIYGGINSGRIVVEVTQGSGGEGLAAGDAKSKRAEVAKQPVQVIVLAIDGLRQDVLYDTTEQKVYPGASSPYYVDPTTLPGFSQILKAENTVKLKDVTAVFPSVTLASWASIFTGKMPKETGITGNELFARDLAIGVPKKFNAPTGMITFDSGAFKGFDQYSLWDMVNDDSFFVPSRWSWEYIIDPMITPQNKPGILKPATIFETISAMPQVKSAVEQRGGDPVVSAYSHYARGARWLTWGDVALGSSEASVLDNLSWTRFEKYLGTQLLGGKGKYLDGVPGLRKRNNVPFSALTVWYLPGLDHRAHVNGMGAYKTYFTGTTDSYIKGFIDWLKKYDEFDNKVFIVVADHGHTEMPTSSEMIYTQTKRNEDGNIIGQKTWNGYAGCELKIDEFNKDKVLYPELANNNLHIWELGEVMRGLLAGDITPEGKALYHKILTPVEIVASDQSGTTTSDPNSASVIAALNGPMAHLYVKGIADWNSDPQSDLLIKIADLLQAALVEGDGPIPRLASSVEAILIRLTQNSDYVVYNGASINEAGQITLNTPIPVNTYFSDNLRFVDALNRITGMNHPKRSGDVVLIMKDATTGNAIDRYTTGVACKAWHGSLNPSDSYIPFVVAYPGGNNFELDPIIKKVCINGVCTGNWEAKDLITEFIKAQYSGQ